MNSGLSNLQSMQSMVEGLAEGVVLCDGAGQVTFMNKTARTIFGERVGTNIREWPGLLGLKVPGTGRPIRPEDIPVMAALSGKTTAIVDVDIETAGTIHHLTLSASPMSMDGKISTAIMICRDITERMSERDRFRAISESSLLGIIIVQDNIITYSNKAANDLAGLQAGELVGKSIVTLIEMVFPEDREFVLESAKKKMAGDMETAAEYEYRLRTKDGKERWVHHYSKPIKLGDRFADFVTVVDITQQKELELAIRTSEEKYKTLFDASPDAIAVVGMDMELLDANVQALKLTGNMKEEVLGKPILELPFILPNAGEGYLELLGSMLRGEDVAPIETCVLNKDGTERWLSARAALLKKDGEPTAILVITKDITANKLAEKVTKESEEKYRTLFESSPMAIALVDMDGNIIDCNQETLDLAGMARSELLGKPFLSLGVLREEDLDSAMERFERMFRGENPEPFEVQVELKDRPLWLEAYTNLIRKDGKVVAILVILKDITSRKQAVQALGDSEKNYRTLFDSSPEAIVVFDMDGNILDCNEETLRLTRMKKEELIGAEFTKFLPHIEKDSPDIGQMFLSVISGEALGPFDIHVRMVGGEEKWLEVTPKVLTNDEGPYAILVITRDITERKTAIAKEERMMAIEQATKMKDAFLANMSHELRTPLNAIVGYTEVMMDELHGPINEKQKEHMDKIYSSSKHLLALISDVLDITKIEAGKMDIQKTPFDVRLILKGVRDDCNEMIRSKGHKVRIEVPDDLPYLTSDETRVRQVLMNLLVNGAKFTPQGGVITMTAAISGDDIVMSVKDNGIGMGPDEMEHVFDAFWQADSSSTKQYQGAGLGLAICKKIVQTLGGRIWIESEKGTGKGTCVSFTIPLEK